ncbi:hypothetical protein BDV34DRAFT_72478 [Aspergillus parasiticus]|uniref:Uncharacterized protein n=1 Tax=Aspergillus parasiticus TaxID=5067 RepID=A0A5N6DPH0_ASPPA|nr:hypothetical protein BDV34DRAFT_72478 [Aspergillus parasiticus]
MSADKSALLFPRSTKEVAGFWIYKQPISLILFIILLSTYHTRLCFEINTFPLSSVSHLSTYIMLVELPGVSLSTH